MQNKENALEIPTLYELELDGMDAEITMEEFDDLAIIKVNGEIIAHYNYSGGGITDVLEMDPRKLISTLASVIADKAKNPFYLR